VKGCHALTPVNASSEKSKDVAARGREVTFIEVYEGTCHKIK